MANNKIQVKRTTVSGRAPNTTNSSNTQYIAAGELALNLTDGKLYTSDGTNLITFSSGGGSSASITISDTAPSSPTAGQLWYYSVDAQLYVYYTDVDSSQWVTASGGGGINNANNALLANNASYLGGVAASSYLQTGAAASFPSLTVTGNVTISNTRISANGSTGTAGQVLTSSGSGANAYWSTPSSGVTTGKAIAMAIVFGG
jgi:hypothetical protein